MNKWPGDLPGAGEISFIMASWPEKWQERHLASLRGAFLPHAGRSWGSIYLGGVGRVERECPGRSNTWHGFYFSLPPNHLTKTNSQLILWINYYTLEFWKASNIFSTVILLWKDNNICLCHDNKGKFQARLVIKAVIYLIKIKLKIWYLSWIWPWNSGLHIYLPGSMSQSVHNRGRGDSSSVR